MTPSLSPAELAPPSADVRSWFIKAEAQCLPTSYRDNRSSQHRTKDASCAVYGPGQSAAIAWWPQQRRSLATDCVSPGSAHCTHCQNRSQPRFLRWSLSCSTQQRAYSGATLMSTNTLLYSVGLPWQYSAAPGAAVDRRLVQCTVMELTVYLSPYNTHTASHRRLVQCTVIVPTGYLSPYNAHTVSHQQVVQCTVIRTPPCAA